MKSLSWLVILLLIIFTLCVPLIVADNSEETEPDVVETVLKTAPESYPYGKPKAATDGVKLSEFQSLAVPSYILGVIFVLFIGVVAYVVYLIFDSQNEKEKKKAEKQKLKEEKKVKKSGSKKAD